jgi:hypothetical protein
VGVKKEDSGTSQREEPETYFSTAPLVEDDLPF